MPVFHIGVKAVILDGNKVLLIRRNEDKEYRSLVKSWDIPGGRIDFGEDPIEGLRREIREETGLELKEVLRPLDATTVFKDEEKQIVRITFLCKAEGDVKLGGEHTEFDWFSLDEVPETKDAVLKASLEKLREEIKKQ